MESTEYILMTVTNFLLYCVLTTNQKFKFFKSISHLSHFASCFSPSSLNCKQVVWIAFGNNKQTTIFILTRNASGATNTKSTSSFIKPSSHANPAWIALQPHFLEIPTPRLLRIIHTKLCCIFRKSPSLTVTRTTKQIYGLPDEPPCRRRMFSLLTYLNNCNLCNRGDEGGVRLCCVCDIL